METQYSPIFCHAVSREVFMMGNVIRNEFLHLGIEVPKNVAIYGIRGARNFSCLKILPTMGHTMWAGRGVCFVFA